MLLASFHMYNVPGKWTEKVAPCNYYNLQLTLLPEDPLGDLAPAAVQKKSASVKSMQ